ncbi:MAG: 1-phosphofructokinase [Propionibacteriaceae bacterium]|nr:1-phosphofructokinase [Propionibacteriaceae bacterium]
MIITVTCNPALDKTATLARLRPRALNRLENVIVDAGGKGVNVSRMIAELGGVSTAMGFVGGGSGTEIEDRLAAQGLTACFTRVAEPTRVNLKLMDSEGQLTELNEPGPHVTAAEYGSLTRALREQLQPGDWVVLSGSLPRGLSAKVYSELVELAAAQGAKACLDADGPALQAALRPEAGRGARPALVKPNAAELQELFGLSEPPGEEQIVRLAEALLVGGVGCVACSRGDQGAVFVNATEAWSAPALGIELRSPVGAGDSMMAALVWSFSLGHGLADAARLAVAASAAACTTEGTKPPDSDLINQLIDQVELRQLR